jgi:hypothetical protein
MPEVLNSPLRSGEADLRAEPPASGQINLSINEDVKAVWSEAIKNKVARPTCAPSRLRQAEKSKRQTTMHKRFGAKRHKKRPSCRARQEGRITSMETTKQQALKLAQLQAQQTVQSRWNRSSQWWKIGHWQWFVPLHQNIRCRRTAGAGRPYNPSRRS